MLNRLINDAEAAGDAEGDTREAFGSEAGVHSGEQLFKQ